MKKLAAALVLALAAGCSEDPALVVAPGDAHGGASTADAANVDPLEVVSRVSDASDLREPPNDVPSPPQDGAAHDVPRAHEDVAGDALPDDTSPEDTSPEDVGPEDTPEPAPDLPAEDTLVPTPEDAAVAADTQAPDVADANAGLPNCAAEWIDGRLVHGDAPPLVAVDPLCGLLSYGRYANEGETSAGSLLPDFSYAGYRRGGVPIPDVPVVKTVSPSPGDDRALIQAAIDEVGALPPDASGQRGAVLLAAGTYQVEGTLTIAAGGVVLRGAGQDAAGSVIVATQKQQHDLIRIEGGGSGWPKVGAAVSITTGVVPVGSSRFQVADASSLAVGHTIAVRRTPNKAWIDALGMAQWGWTTTAFAINHERRITAIDGDTIVVDIPLVDAIDAKYGGGEVFVADLSSRISRAGVEDLRLVSEYATPDDEAHGWNAVVVSRATDSWVRRVTAVHFGYSAVTVRDQSAFVTVEEVAQLDPISIVDGGRRYSFYVDGGVGVLFQRCYARDGRHNFVSGGRVTGPHVWLDSLSMKNNNDEGPHHRWATGLLFDRCMSEQFNVQNRADSGSGHGWAGAQTLFWNIKATEAIRCDAPTGAMNWAVGAIGTKTQGSWAPDEPFGIWESAGTPVTPSSLYLAQLADRLGPAAVASVTLPQQLDGTMWNELNHWAGVGRLDDSIPASTWTCAGIAAGAVCCPSSCGVCGGSGCSALPGGESKCCAGAIKDAGKSCASNPPPCVLP